jgi:hypothetical protein
MSLIKEIPKMLESKRLTRKMTILDPDDRLGLPRLEFEIASLGDKRLSSLTDAYTKKKGTSAAEIIDFRKAVCHEVVKDWSGMCTENARRLCLVLAEHPELIDENVPRDWPFDPDDLQFIAEHMPIVTFNDILNESLDVNAFAKEELAKTKKS